MMRSLSLFLMLLMATPLLSMAQEGVDQEEVNVDDLGNVTDEFKENFFNALAEKAKGNLDRAIPLLKRCLELEPDSGAVYFELGKNYLMDNAFAKAETSILKAIDLAGRREWLLDALHDAYDKQQKSAEALTILEELAEINPTYQELLPYRLMKAGRYEDALSLLDELDGDLGEDINRERLRREINRITGGNKPDPTSDSTSIADLERAIAANPADEDAYLKLMYVYGQSGNNEKVIAVATAMNKSLPHSDRAQLALYRIYLDSNQLDESIASIIRIFKSEQLDTTDKVKVLNDFLQVALENEAMTMAIQKVVSSFNNEVTDANAFGALGEMLVKKNRADLAQEFYTQGLALDGQNFELLKRATLLAIDREDFQAALHTSSSALEVYPSQSLFYLLNGVAHNKMNQPQMAIEQLENGLLYLLDEPTLERDIYSELEIAYRVMGNETKAMEMRSKVATLNKQIK